MLWLTMSTPCLWTCSAPQVHLDDHLTRATWGWPGDEGSMPAAPSSEQRIAAWDPLLKRWEDNYKEYSRRFGELRRSRADADVEGDEVYWAAYRALVDDFRQRLYDHHPGYLLNQGELYREVAAMYEVCVRAIACAVLHAAPLPALRTLYPCATCCAASCAAYTLPLAHCNDDISLTAISTSRRLCSLWQACYRKAQHDQRRREQLRLQSAPSAEPEPTAECATGLIKFPWRIAPQILIDMKKKAPEFLKQRQQHLRLRP